MSMTGSLPRRDRRKFGRKQSLRTGVRRSTPWKPIAFRSSSTVTVTVSGAAEIGLSTGRTWGGGREGDAADGCAVSGGMRWGRGTVEGGVDC